MKLAIVGSRRFPRLELVTEFVNRLKPETTVVSGGAKGVDLAAEKAARARGLKTEIFFPRWDELGKKAGPERNLIMLAKVDGVVAFWDGSSPGTAHAIVTARNWKKWLRIYREDGSFETYPQPIEEPK